MMHMSKISQLAHILSMFWEVLSLDIGPTGLLCICTRMAATENDKCKTNNL